MKPEQFDSEGPFTVEENERIQELLAEFGLATIMAQAVEHGLVTLLALAAQRDHAEMSGEDIRRLMDTRYSQTMGVLVRDSTRAIGLAQETQDLLTRSLRIRNFLAHEFFRRFAPASFDPLMGQQAVVLLHKARALFEKAQEAVQREMDILLPEIGVTPEEATQRGFKAVERYIEAGVDSQALWSDLENRPPK